MSPAAKKTARSVRYTRALQRDRSQRPLSAPSDEPITARLTAVVHPATLHLVNYCHQLGLRARRLTLPVRVALVLSLSWRQFNGVSALVRVVPQETLWWVSPLPRVSQPALAQRWRTLPAALCRHLLCPL